MYIITVPAIPPSPNILKRKYRNPHSYARLRKQWEHDLFYCIDGSWRRQHLANTAKSAKMWVQVTLHHSKLYDADNLVGSLKPVLDAMVKLGFLANDDAQHLQLLPAEQVKCARKECKTVVKIGVVD